MIYEMPAGPNCTLKIRPVASPTGIFLEAWNDNDGSWREIIGILLDGDTEGEPAIVCRYNIGDVGPAPGFPLGTFHVEVNERGHVLPRIDTPSSGPCSNCRGTGEVCKHCGFRHSEWLVYDGAALKPCPECKGKE